MTGITEKTLSNLAEAIGDDPNLKTLGLNFGFRESKIKQYLATNRVDGDIGSKGTSNMLFDWKKKTQKANQVSALREALVKAGLVEYADEFLPEGGQNPVQVTNPPPQGAGATGGHSSNMAIKVTDDYLNDIVNDFPNKLFSEICSKLGWGENHAQNELEGNNKNYKKTFRSALADWKNRNGGTRQEVVDILAAAGYKI